MESENSTYHIPSYARPAAYAFAEPATPEITELYRELTSISEEILKCRSQKL